MTRLLDQWHAVTFWLLVASAANRKDRRGAWFVGTR